MNEATLESISLAAPEAARLLGISPRTLWQLTKDGAVPHLRLAGRVTYPHEALKKWANERAQVSMKKTGVA